jgi:hypothetical protein
VTGDEIARALVDALGAIEPGDALDQLAAQRLAALPPGDAAELLAALAARRPGTPAERKVLGALCRALVWGAPRIDDERRRAIRAQAHARGLGAASALLTEAAPERQRDSDGSESRRGDPEATAQTLGHRTQYARAAPLERLPRIAADDDPRVIRNLLLNPRLTEPLVVRIASRRPTSAEVLTEVARSGRWGVRPQVRRALALNPYAPPTVVSTLLPQLGAPDLREIAASPVLHPAVRSAARALLAARGEAQP